MNEYQQFTFPILTKLMSERFNRDFTFEEAAFFHKKAYEQLFVITRQVLRDLNYYSGKDHQKQIEEKLSDLGTAGGHVFYMNLEELPDLLELFYELDNETCEKGIRLSFNLILYIELYTRNRITSESTPQQIMEIHKDSFYFLSKKINESLINEEKLQDFIENLTPDLLVDNLYDEVEKYLKEEQA